MSEPVLEENIKSLGQFIYYWMSKYHGANGLGTILGTASLGTFTHNLGVSPYVTITPMDNMGTRHYYINTNGTAQTVVGITLQDTVLHVFQWGAHP